MSTHPRLTDHWTGYKIFTIPVEFDKFLDCVWLKTDKHSSSTCTLKSAMYCLHASRSGHEAGVLSIVNNAILLYFPVLDPIS